MIDLLSDSSTKSKDKRAKIISAVCNQVISIHDLISVGSLDDKKTVIVLESIEEITRKTPEAADAACLLFAASYISADSNAIKREASRIVGNLAHLFPEHLEPVIGKLLDNTNNVGTVVRWGSAYAVGKIVQIPQFANSNLYLQVTTLSEGEKENGVKNQYLNGLKRAKKLRHR